MKHLAAVFWTFLFVDLFALAIFVLASVGNERASLASITPFLVLAGVSVAVLTLTLKHLRDRSEDYLESAVKMMEKAYRVLADNKDEDGRPKNSRRNWLTSARLLRTAQKIAGLIEEESHKVIWHEEERYWRAQFHSLINPADKGFPANYYAESAEKFIVVSGNDRDPLSEKSLAVLYRFLEWPEKEVDPIGEEPRFSDKELEHHRYFGARGLGEMLLGVREFLANVKVENEAKNANQKPD